MTPYFPGIVAAGHSTKLEALCLLPVFLLALDMILERPGAGAGRLPGRSGGAPRLGEPPAGGLLRAPGRVPLRRRRCSSSRSGPPGAPTGFASRGSGSRAAVLAAGMAAEPYLAVREYAPWSIRGAARRRRGRQRRRLGLRDRLVVPSAGAGVVPLPGLVRAAGADLLGADAVHAVDPLLRRGRAGRWRCSASRGRAGRAAGSGAASRSSCSSSASAGSCRSSTARCTTLVPFFNRFRVPSMIYSILPLCLAFPVAAGLDALLAAPGPRRRPAACRRGREAQGSGSAVAPRPPRRGACSDRGGRWSSSGSCWPSAPAARLSGPGALLRPEEVGRLDPGQMQALQGERLSLLQQSVAHGMIVLLLGLGVLALRRFRAAAAVDRPPRRPRGRGRRRPRRALVLPGRAHARPPATRSRCREPATFSPASPGRSGSCRRTPRSSRSNAFGLVRLESIGGYHTAQAARLPGPRRRRPHHAAGRPLDAERPLHPRARRGSTRLGTPLYQGDGFVYAWPDSLPRAWAVRHGGDGRRLRARSRAAWRATASVRARPRSPTPARRRPAPTTHRRA